MRRIKLPVLLLAAALALTGCAGSKREEQLIKPDGESHPAQVLDIPFENAPEPENPPEEDGSGGKAEDLQEKETISPEDPGGMLYLLLPSAEGPSLTERDIITAASRDAGVGIVVLNYGGDPFAEAEAFETAVREGAVMIVCDNVDETQTQRAAERAEKAGVPVILMGRGIDAYGVVSSQVLIESYSCIRKIGEEYAAFSGGNARCLVLNGQDSAEDLGEAFSMVIDSNPGMTLMGSATCSETVYDEAYEAAWTLLREHTDADTMAVYNTLQTRAACDAAADLDRDIRILCLAGDTDEITDMIRQGKVHSAVVKPAAELAETCAKQIRTYFLEGELPVSECVYVQGSILAEEDESQGE